MSADVKRVPELLSPEVRRQPTSSSTRTPHPRIDDLAEYDAIVVGTGTPFGRVPSQIASFLDQADNHWAKGALHGNVGGTFASRDAARRSGDDAVHHHHRPAPLRCEGDRTELRVRRPDES